MMSGSFWLKGFQAGVNFRLESLRLVVVKRRLLPHNLIINISIILAVSLTYFALN